MTKKVELQVNGTPIVLEHFVESFVEHTVSGMLESLEDTGTIKDLKLSMEDDKINIMLNGKHIDTNEFVNKIMKSTLYGMVFPLKGVNIKNISELQTLEIKFTR
jgi:hypothetical protein